MSLDTSAQGIRISVLGPPRVERDGRAIAFDTRKAIALLAYLACEDRPQRRDTLATLLWPDADEAHARAALRRTLSVVKRGLGDGPGFSVTREEVTLTDGPGVHVDVRAFLSGVASEDLDDVTGAAALWHGELLEGFSLRDSPSFDAWQGREAEHLRSVLTTASARLVESLAAAGRVDDALAHAERWLRLDALHEPAHRALMRLHAQRGDRAAAVRQYRACVRVVDDELGVAPLAETTALYEAIAAGEVADRTAPPAEVAPATVSGHYPLIGRAAEVAALDAAIGPGRVVVVEGEPGVGKTRLVEETLAGRDRRPLVVRCYDSDGDVPYGPIAELLRLALADPLAVAALSSLPAACVGEAARLVPELATVAASRWVDGPGAEARFVDGVSRAVLAAGSAPPGVIVVDDVQWADRATQEVLAHLVRRGGGTGPCFVLTLRTDEIRDAGPLSHALLDRSRGNGRVIRLRRLQLEDVAELASGCVPADAVEQVAADIHRDSEGLPFLVVAYLDALASGQPAVADLGVLLRARLAALSDGAAQVFATASVIGRSFSFDAVRIASGRSDEETVAALEELVGNGLVDERETPDGPAYDFAHGEVRRFVYDGTSLARRRLLHHRVAEAIISTARGSGDPASRAAVVAHHERQAGREAAAAEHFRQAGEHARVVYANADALGHFEAALALGHPAIAELHESIGDLETLDGRFDAAIASYERSAARCGPDDVHRLERKLGGVHQRCGQLATAERHQRAALSALSDDAPAAARALILADLAITVHRLGDDARAADLAGRAVSEAERSDDDAARTNAGTVAGLLAASRGDAAAARALLTASFEVASRLEDPGPQVAAANGLARLERAAGRFDRALELLVRGVEQCVAIGDRHREAALRDQLAEVLHELGRREEAMAQLKQAVAIFADIGSSDGSVLTEVWRLSEWVDQGAGVRRNDSGTAGRDNVGVTREPTRAPST
ncbi:MAG: AAA family ATPase [Microthrixaceae bacterium]